MSKFSINPQTVRLNGERLRALREEKGLTQLYISEVVGVSVETVSRWENNRTDAVRRENAIALASALEVELSLLLHEEKPQTSNATGRPAKKSPVFMAAIVAFACIAATAGFLYLGSDPVAVKGVRLLPPYSPPGYPVPVVIDVGLVSGDKAKVVVREQLPAGWRIKGSSPIADSGPDSQGVVKWIVQLNAAAERIFYLAEPPPGGKESADYTFSGHVVTRSNGSKVSGIVGESRLDLEYVHWADEDADFRIDDAEVLEALERLESAGGLGLDPADLRRLWGANEYEWNQEKGGFIPLDQP